MSSRIFCFRPWGRDLGARAGSPESVRRKRVARPVASTATPLMDPKAKVATQPASAETNTTVVSSTISNLPHDIIAEILDHLRTADSRRSDSRRTLLSCSLISKSWVVPCRRRLFRTILFTWAYVAGWLEAFPVPEKSPAYYVKDLQFSFPGWRSDTSTEFFDHIPWFVNVRTVSWNGQADLCLFHQILSLGSLSQTLTSLSLERFAISVLQIRDIMAQLDNLDDLRLSGFLIKIGKDSLCGIGTALRGRFGGRLTLLEELVDPDIADMLLEVPTGLHFTEMYVYATRHNLHSVVRLSEACGANLTKLTYVVGDLGESRLTTLSGAKTFRSHLLDSGRREAFAHTFDFAKLPNLEEANFGAHFLSVGSLWVRKTLSAITPATSPCLSVLRFDHYTLRRAGGPSLEQLPGISDYKRIEGEVFRIEHEFKGAVKVILNGFLPSRCVAMLSGDALLL